MLRLEGEIYPLRRCGTWRNFSQSPMLTCCGTACGAGSYVLRDDIGIGPAVKFPITRNHAPRSMLLTMLDRVLIRCHSLIYTLPLLQ